ncbi:GNAT family N-acetyltransferase [Streptomyces tateyamensis]|uniref:GNAT family N-acetyltransferase n=1 Tax=Streptomyces tateyamensis TaxID=565073 RepID=A0A2V4NJW9_9ACTN|nr:GNAT family N-acetyltransferase [Streptomyces tateyamensis]PYC73023.1 GNAT family N-acetyltransferase [Streptomyces tateyamensis]
MQPTIETADITDLLQVVEDNDRYWGERDLRSAHLRALVKEFAATCFVARSEAGILAYLVGFVTPDATGYVHLVATRDDARGQGLAGRLYGEFATVARSQGAVRLKAITSLPNTGSVAFHRSQGFRDEVVADYLGPGHPMVVFHRDLT